VKGERMMLGEKILNLRKQKGLSQEQLGEEIGVTRQTISNWELNETQPNPEQLKSLSKVLNISIDELLDNDIKNVLEKGISNTERLAGIVIKILKILGIALIVFFIIDILALIIFASIGKLTYVESSATTVCKIEDDTYTIEFGTNKYFDCENCPEEMNLEIKKLVDFNNIDKSMRNVEDYFKSKNGSCE